MGSDDGPSIGLAILGFAFPLMGGIIWLCMRGNTPLKAKSAGTGAAWGAGVGFFTSFGTIVLLTVLGSQIKNDFNNGRSRAATTAQSAPPAPIVNARYHTIATFSGSSTQTTEPFHIRGSRFLVTYRSETDTPAMSIFQIYVRKAGGGLVAVAANGQGNLDSSSAVFGSGDYYLLVNTANCRWAAVVSDYY